MPNNLDVSKWTPELLNKVSNTPIGGYEVHMPNSSQYDDNGFLFRNENQEDITEHRAQEQDNWDKAANGLLAATAKVVPRAIEGIVNPIYGSIDAIFSQDKSKLWDNALVDAANNVSESISESLPLYSTQEANKANGFDKLLYANTYFGDILDGISYSAAAMLSGSAYTKAASLIGKTAAIGKLGEYLGGLKSIEKSKDVLNYITKYDDLFKTKLVGGLEKGTYSLIGAATEASDNARSDSKEWAKNMEYKLTHDEQGNKLRDLTPEEAASIEQNRKELGNSSYIMNLPVIMADNWLTFGKTVFSKKSLEKLANKDVAESALYDAAQDTYYAAKKSKIDKVLNKTYGLRKAFETAIPEGLQETSQLGITKGTQDYYTKKYYNPNAASFVDSFGVGLDASMSKEGLSNFLIGAISAGVFGNAVTMVKDGRKGYQDNTDEKIKSTVDYLNANKSKPVFQSLAESFVRHNNLSEEYDDAVKNNNDFEAMNKASDMLVNHITSKIKTDKLDDFKAKLNEFSQLSPNEFEQEFGIKLGTDELTGVKKSVHSFVDSKLKAANKIEALNNSLDSMFPNISENLKDRLLYSAYSIHDSESRTKELNNKIRRELVDNLFLYDEDYNTINTDYINLSNEDKVRFKKALDTNKINPLSVEEIKNYVKDIDNLEQRKNNFIDEYKFLQNKDIQAIYKAKDDADKKAVDDILSGIQEEKEKIKNAPPKPVEVVSDFADDQELEETELSNYSDEDLQSIINNPTVLPGEEELKNAAIIELQNRQVTQFNNLIKNASSGVELDAIINQMDKAGLQPDFTLISKKREEFTKQESADKINEVINKPIEELEDHTNQSQFSKNSIIEDQKKVTSGNKINFATRSTIVLEVDGTIKTTSKEDLNEEFNSSNAKPSELPIGTALTLKAILEPTLGYVYNPQTGQSEKVNGEKIVRVLQPNEVNETNFPIGIYHNGELVGYYPTVQWVNEGHNNQKFNVAEKEHAKILEEVSKFRQEVWNNKQATFETNVNNKGLGSLFIDKDGLKTLDIQQPTYIKDTPQGQQPFQIADGNLFVNNPGLANNEDKEYTKGTLVQFIKMANGKQLAYPVLVPTLEGGHVESIMSFLNAFYSNNLNDEQSVLITPALGVNPQFNPQAFLEQFIFSQTDQPTIAGQYRIKLRGASKQLEITLMAADENPVFITDIASFNINKNKLKTFLTNSLYSFKKDKLAQTGSHDLVLFDNEFKSVPFDTYSHFVQSVVKTKVQSKTIKKDGTVIYAGQPVINFDTPKIRKEKTEVATTPTTPVSELDRLNNEVQRLINIRNNDKVVRQAINDSNKGRISLEELDAITKKWNNENGLTAAIKAYDDEKKKQTAPVSDKKADIDKTLYGTISGSIPLSQALPNGIYIDLGNGLFGYADKNEKIAAIVDKNNNYLVSKSFWNATKKTWQTPNLANLKDDAKKLGVDEATYIKKYQDAVNVLNAKYDAELDALNNNQTENKSKKEYKETGTIEGYIKSNGNTISSIVKPNSEYVNNTVWKVENNNGNYYISGLRDQLLSSDVSTLEESLIKPLFETDNMFFNKRATNIYVLKPAKIGKNNDGTFYLIEKGLIRYDNLENNTQKSQTEIELNPFLTQNIQVREIDQEFESNEFDLTDDEDNVDDGISFSISPKQREELENSTALNELFLKDVDGKSMDITKQTRIINRLVSYTSQYLLDGGKDFSGLFNKFFQQLEVLRNNAANTNNTAKVKYYNNLLEQEDKIKDFTVTQFKKFGLIIKPGELLVNDTIDEDNEVTEKEQRFDVDNIKKDPNEGITWQVKLMLNNIKDTKSNVKFLGDLETLPFKDVNELMLQILADGNFESFQTMLDFLNANYKEHYIVKQVVDKISNFPLHYKNMFFIAMNNKKNNLQIMSITKNKKRDKTGKFIATNLEATETYSSDRNSAIQTLLNQWNNNAKTGRLVKEINGEKFLNTERVRELKALVEEFRLAGKQMDTEAAYKFLQDLFTDLNIDTKLVDILIDPVMQLKYISYKSTLLKNGIKGLFDGGNGLIYNIVKSLDKVIINDKEEYNWENANPFIKGGADNSIKILAKMAIATGTEVAGANSAKNINKDTYWNFSNSSHLDFTINKLKNLTSNTIETLRKIPSLVNNYWLKNNFIKNVSKAELDGLKQSNSSKDGVQRPNMTLAEQLLTVLTGFTTKIGDNYKQMVFVAPTLSDKSNANTLLVVNKLEKPAITLNGKEFIFSKDAITALKDIATDEFGRINSFLLAKDKIANKNGGDFKKAEEILEHKLGSRHYSGADKFILFPAFTELMKDATLEVSRQDIFNNNLDEVVTKMFTSMIVDLHSTLKSTNLITNEFAYLTKGYIDTITKQGLKNNDEIALYVAGELVVNYALNYSGYMELIGGNIAQFYKTNATTGTYIEYTKRGAKDVAPGTDGNWKYYIDNELKLDNSEQLKIYAKDFNAVPFGDYLQKQFGVSTYEVTDAQEYTTILEHINRMFAFEDLSWEKYSAMRNKIINGVELSKKDIEVILQPFKLVYVNSSPQDVEGYSFLEIAYDKTSSFPLIPGLTKGSELDKVRLAMEKVERENNFKGVSLVYKSGAKGTLKNIVDIWNSDGTIKNDINDQITTNVNLQSREGLRKQQHNPLKKSSEILIVSQMDKLIHDGTLFMNFVLNGVEKSGKQLRELKEGIRIEQYKRAAVNLLDELGVYTQDNNVFKFNDLNKLIEVLKKEDREGKFSINDFAALTLDENNQLKYPLSLINKASEFELFLNSIITNRIIKTKITGTSKIQGTSAGFKFLEDYTEQEKSGIIYTLNEDGSRKFDGNKLNHLHKNENGEVKVAQVFLPWKFKGLNMEDFLTPDGKHIDPSKLPNKLLQLIGARIPNQAHNSQLPIEIAGFLPKSFGDLMLVPYEIAKQMGSDFDVDKLYAYLNKHFITDEGVQVLEPNPDIPLAELSSEELEQLYKDIHWSILSDPQMTDKIVSSLDKEDLKEEIKLVDNKKLIELESPLYLLKHLLEYESQKDAKELVGLTSNDVVANVILQGNNLYLQTKEDKKFVRKTIDNFEGFELSNLSGYGNSVYNGQKRTVTENLIIGQNAVLDNAKEKIAGILNINKVTYGVYSILVRLSENRKNISLQDQKALSLDYVAKFINQPIIREYVELVKNKQSSLNPNPSKNAKGDAIQELVEKYSTGLSDEEFQALNDIKFNVKNLKDNLNKFNTKYQLAILNLYSELDGYAEDWNKIQTVIKSDVNGATEDLITASAQADKIYRLNYASSIANGLDLLGEFDEETEDFTPTTQFGWAFELGPKLSANLWSEFYPYNKEGYKLIEKEIEKLTSKDDVISSDFRRTVWNNFKAYIFSNNELGLFNDSVEERNRLLNNSFTIVNGNKQWNKDSLASRAIKLKGTVNNLILKALTPEIATKKGDFNLLKFNVGGAKIDGDEYTKAFYDLLMSNDEEISTFAQDLISYHYITSGTQNSINIVKYIPIEYLNTIPEFSNTLNRVFNNLEQRPFIKQFIQSNPRYLYQLQGDLKTILNAPNVLATKPYPEKLTPNPLASELNGENGYKPYFAVYDTELKRSFIYEFDKGSYYLIPTLGTNKLGSNEYQFGAEKATSLINEVKEAVRDNNVIEPVNELSKTVETPVTTNTIEEEFFNLLKLKNGNKLTLLNSLNLIANSKSKYAKAAQMYIELQDLIAEDLVLKIENIDNRGSVDGTSKIITLSPLGVQKASEASNRQTTLNDVAELLLHEVNHLVNKKLLDVATKTNTEEFEKYVKNNKELYQTVYKLNNLLQQARNYIQANPITDNDWLSKRVNHALSNLTEFASAAYDTEIQQIFAKIPTNEKNKSLLDKLKSLLTDLIAAISTHLNINIKGSLLEDILETNFKINEELLKWKNTEKVNLESNINTKIETSEEKTSIEITKSDYTKDTAPNNPTTGFIFTENAEMLDTDKNVSMTQAIIRTTKDGLKNLNALPIITKKLQVAGGQWANTEEDFNEFKRLNKMLIERHLSDNWSKLVFPQGFATDKAQLPTRFAEWLQKELLNNFGLVTELNSTKTGLISKSVQTTQPQTVENKTFSYNGITIPTEFELGEDQKNALISLIDFVKSGNKDNKIKDVITLQGAAGTGKTTIIGYLFKYLQQAKIPYSEVYMAPTHAATAELAFATVKTGNTRLPSTLQSAITINPKTNKGVFTKKIRDIIGYSPIIILDESSMIDAADVKNITEAVENEGGKLIFLGDEKQISKVNNADVKQVSPAFTKFKQINLKKIFRQSENNLLFLLNKLREQKDFKLFKVPNSPAVQFVNRKEYNEQLINDLQTNPENTTIITYTNDAVKKLNNSSRQVLGFSGSPKVGEIVVGYLGYATKQIEKQNIANSIPYTITDVEKDGSKYIIVVKSQKLENLIKGGIKGIIPQAKANYYQLSSVDSLLFEDLTNEDFENNNKEISKIFRKIHQLNLDYANKKISYAAYQDGITTNALTLANYSVGNKYIFNPATDKMELFDANKHRGIKQSGQGSLVFEKDIDFGYAITIHKSQGTTIGNVYFDLASVNVASNTKIVDEEGNQITTEKQSLAYVGMSRSKNKLVISENELDLPLINEQQSNTNKSPEKGLSFDELPDSASISPIKTQLNNKEFLLSLQSQIEEIKKYC